MAWKKISISNGEDRNRKRDYFILIIHFFVFLFWSALHRPENVIEPISICKKKSERKMFLKIEKRKKNRLKRKAIQILATMLTTWRYTHYFAKFLIFHDRVDEIKFFCYV